MKYLNSVFIGLMSSIIFFIHIHADSVGIKDTHEFLLTVTIMVKNEADVIIPTLQPFIDAGVTSFLVYDTGSTDGTQDVIRKHFDKCSIEHAYIVEEPFIDFAASRNRALELTEEIFVNNTFIVMLDAEWYTHNVEELITFCQEHKNYIASGCSGSCYLTRLFTVADNINNYTPRLIRQGCNVRYAGVVHESIPDIASGIVPEAFFFEYRPAQYGKDKSNARCVRDYALLKKSHQDDPANMRTLFYLGQTCQFMDDWEQAIFYYHKRLDMGPISVEKYLAAYRIACAIEHIVAHDPTQQKYTQEDAAHYYLMAYNMLPYRAEPLFRIACYFIRHNLHAVAYLFAIRAAQLPYPAHDTLFIESRVYDYLRYDILSQCAMYAGEYEIGKAASLKALETEPNDQFLLERISFYNDCLKQQ